MPRANTFCLTKSGSPKQLATEICSALEVHTRKTPYLPLLTEKADHVTAEGVYQDTRVTESTPRRASYKVEASIMTFRFSCWCSPEVAIDVLNRCQRKAKGLMRQPAEGKERERWCRRFRWSIPRWEVLPDASV